MTSCREVHVAVGVVRNHRNEVLISLRPNEAHQGGLWEFPGGKVDPGEDVKTALCREFEEELGITPTRFFPFLKISHHYPDKHVLLDVWLIIDYSGVPEGREGQAVRWQSVDRFDYRDFPKANTRIIDALRLPQHIPVSPELTDLDSLERLLSRWKSASYTLAYLRQNHLSPAQYSRWLSHANTLCEASDLVIMADSEKSLSLDDSGSQGIHIKSSRLLQLSELPDFTGGPFSASCHNLQELQKAESLGVNFVFLSPVNKVSRYADSKPLGWGRFEELAGAVSVPVYALGGLALPDLDKALFCGATGIAGISAFDDG